MFKEIKDTYDGLQEQKHDVVLGGGKLVTISVNPHLSTVDKLGMVTTVFEACVSENDRILTFDKGMAKILLKTFLITKCTNLQMPDTKQEYATISKFFEFYDALTPNGVNNILSVINKTLCIDDIYQELLDMLLDKTNEFMRVREIENSLGVSIINWLNEKGKDQLLKLDSISDALNSLGTLFTDIENVIDVNNKIQKMATEENNRKAKKTTTKTKTEVVNTNEQ